MNKKQMILAATMFFAATNFSYAQFFYPALGTITPAKKISLDQNYAADLASQNKGLVESALAIVSMVKLDLPLEKLPMVKEKIEDLIVSGETPVIRYKAYLAGAVFADPAMFRQESSHTYENTDDFFNALAGKLSHTLLSLNK
jgi:hypothetical protein